VTESSAFARIDEAGDRMLEPLRRMRATSFIFGVASTVGDFSIVWHIIGFVRAIGSARRFHEALFLSCALGVESLVVNQGVKRMFERERPTASGDERFDIRTPSTSSFPSGHASSATFAAILLVRFIGMPTGIVFVVLAVVVALSRVVVRIHHLSDIIGGIVTGAVLGTAAAALAGSVL
jgi:undecaprenyl-diphosphatase